MPAACCCACGPEASVQVIKRIRSLKCMPVSSKNFCDNELGKGKLLNICAGIPASRTCKRTEIKRSCNECSCKPSQIKTDCMNCTTCLICQPMNEAPKRKNRRKSCCCCCCSCKKRTPKTKNSAPSCCCILISGKELPNICSSSTKSNQHCCKTGKKACKRRTKSQYSEPRLNIVDPCQFLSFSSWGQAKPSLSTNFRDASNYDLMPTQSRSSNQVVGMIKHDALCSAKAIPNVKKSESWLIHTESQSKGKFSRRNPSNKTIREMSSSLKGQQGDKFEYSSRENVEFTQVKANGDKDMTKSSDKINLKISTAALKSRVNDPVILPKETYTEVFDSKMTETNNPKKSTSALNYGVNAPDSISPTPVESETEVFFLKQPNVESSFRLVGTTGNTEDQNDKVYEEEFEDDGIGKQPNTASSFLLVGTTGNTEVQKDKVNNEQCVCEDCECDPNDKQPNVESSSLLVGTTGNAEPKNNKVTEEIRTSHHEPKSEWHLIKDMKNYRILPLEESDHEVIYKRDMVKDMHHLKERLELLNSTKHELESQVKGLKVLETQVSNLQEENLQFRKRINSFEGLESKLNNLAKENNDLKSSLKKSENLIESLNSQLSDEKNKYEMLKKSYAKEQELQQGSGSKEKPSSYYPKSAQSAQFPQNEQFTGMKAVSFYSYERNPGYEIESHSAYYAPDPELLTQSASQSFETNKVAHRQKSNQSEQYMQRIMKRLDSLETEKQTRECELQQAKKKICKLDAEIRELRAERGRVCGNSCGRARKKSNC